MRAFALVCALLFGCGSAAGGGSGTAGSPAGSPSTDGGTPNAGKFGLSVAVSGQGKVVSTPAGIDCGSTCVAAFGGGISVSLAVQPAPGWRFDSWGGACTGATLCSVVMSSDTQVFATFVLIPPQQHALQVTLTGTGGGRVTSDPAGIDCGANCWLTFADGSMVTLTAVAAAGSYFAGWAGACSGTTSCTLTMTSDEHVSARFDPSTDSRPRMYSITEVPGVEGVADLSPTSINQSGDVVGSYRLSLSRAHAFLYDAASGTTQRIAADSTDVQGAAAINSARDVAISTLISPPVQQRAYRWQAGVETNIGALPPGPNSPQSGANAINESGWIAGWSLGSANWQRAVLWDGTALYDLGSLAGTWSMANAINSNGVVVGSTAVKDDVYPHAAAFDRGTIHDLGSLGPTGSTAYGINDSGRVVGASSVGAGPLLHAFVYDLPSGPMRDVSPNQPCTLIAVNGSGDAVGSCSPADRVNHAALWHRDTMADLNDAISDPSWLLIIARAINDAGQITGTGTRNGEARAFILTPQ